MQQVLAYFELSKYECELTLADLIRNKLEIVQFQIIKEDEGYSLYVVVRPGSEDSWVNMVVNNTRYARIAE